MPIYAARAAALVIFSALTSAPVPGAHAAEANEANVYSYRQLYLIEPLFKAFTNATGIKVNVSFAEKGLIECMAAEGRNSPADVLLTMDVGNLMQPKEAGIGRPIYSAALEAAIPAAYRDMDGFTRCARVVYASKKRVSADRIPYEELADPKWRGKICIRSGQHVYKVALIALMITVHGDEEWTKTWLKGVKTNLAHKPAGEDRMQVKDVYAGECDIAVGNTYYMGPTLRDDKEPEQKEWANSVDILFPITLDRGTHVNISGAVVATYAPHLENAIKLLEFLAHDEGQKTYAQANRECPVKAGVPWSPPVQSWGDFKPDRISLNEVAALRKKASELVDKVGFDDGPRT
jgi:iron(III) transport system substrate-binding protein